MLSRAAVLVVALGIVGDIWMPPPSQLHFDGGIGVIPVSAPLPPANTDGTFQNVAMNVVRGIRPARQNWRIADLEADVYSNGRIEVTGSGLLLAGGDNIGRTGNTRVFATLVCEGQEPFVERNTAASVDGIAFDGTVPLDANGDFHIDDTLKLVGGGLTAAPPDCASPALLIRSASGAWLAAGIPRLAPNER